MVTRLLGIYRLGKIRWFLSAYVRMRMVYAGDLTDVISIALAIEYTPLGLALLTSSICRRRLSDDLR